GPHVAPRGPAGPARLGGRIEPGAAGRRALRHGEGGAGGSRCQSSEIGGRDRADPGLGCALPHPHGDRVVAPLSGRTAHHLVRELRPPLLHPHRPSCIARPGGDDLGGHPAGPGGAGSDLPGSPRAGGDGGDVLALRGRGLAFSVRGALHGMKLFSGSFRTLWLPALMASTILLLAMTVPCRAQCAMCEGSAAAGGDGGAVYNRSTLFMLSVPYLLLLGV